MLPSNCTKSVVQLAVECRGRISRARPSCEASARTTGARRRSYQARAGGARAHGCSARCTARDGPRSPRCGAGWRLELGRGVAGSPWWPRCARAYRCAPVEAAVCAGTRRRRATTTPTAASAAQRASLSIWSCTRLARVLWGSPWSNAARWLASKVAGGEALATPHKGRPREARQAPPWTPAQLRRRMRYRTAPHPEALPNSAMVRPMIPTVFGDSFACSHLQTETLADGHPLAAESHRNMLWAACENV